MTFKMQVCDFQTLIAFFCVNGIEIDQNDVEMTFELSRRYSEIKIESPKKCSLKLCFSHFWTS